MKTISVQTLKTLLAKGNLIDLIDVRTPAEFASVHVPEATLSQLDGLDCGAILASRKAEAHEPIYILCHSGVRAGKAASKFASFGFRECVVVEGGTQAWVDAGFEVVRGERKVLPLDRQMQMTVGTMILSGVLLGRFVNPNWIWLSGFGGAGLIMAGTTGFCPLRNLIALMPWNQVKSCSKDSDKGSCCC